MTNPIQSIAETSMSPGMQNIVKTILRLASSDLGILLVGEYGTGKEWLARKIHQLSPRAKNVFLTIDCRTLSPSAIDLEMFGQERLINNERVVEEGFLEEAESGTLFLDGFTSLPVDMQMKIARAMGHQKFHRFGHTKELWFNARVIISVTQGPEKNRGEWRVHQDILSRMSPIVIEIPPLRERQEDLLRLINVFISQMNNRYRAKVRGISPEALRLCLLYGWPGNIRELRNTMEYAVMMAHDHLIQPAHLPLQIRGARGRDASVISFRRLKSVSAVEKFLILDALRRARTKKDAAKLLGITLRTLRNKLEHYSLSAASSVQEAEDEDPTSELHEND